MYGVEIPRDSFNARRLDKENGNTRWVEAEHLEYEFANEKVFGNRMLAGYTKI